jgi:D-lactate dehydrogenase (cytochrome)
MANSPPHIETDPDVLLSFLSDAAHVPGGFAAGVAFPRSAAEVAAIVSSASAVLPIGAQSSLTGGATPRGEVILSTRALTHIAIDRTRRLVRVGAGVPLSALQAALAAHDLWYPPAPTFDGAFVGGTVATNAAGAATFKYGTTRHWVNRLVVVLASGDVVSLDRGKAVAGANGFAVDVRGDVVRVPVPSYTMPDVPKLSAGYFARPGMDLVDLFVGSEGTLGVIVEATLRVVPRPRRAVALVSCTDDEQAMRTTRALRERAQRTWLGDGTLDVSAIEFMDAMSVAFVPDAAFARAGVGRPTDGSVLLLVQAEVPSEVDETIGALADTLTAAGVVSDPVVALPGDDAAATRLFELREAVPIAVNAAVAVAKQRDPQIQKTAGDFIVPFDRLDESVAFYRRACESNGLTCAIWGHVSDGNLHPNVIPRSREEMAQGREALLEMARAVVAMGGSPLAEHGVGRSPLKQQLLHELYGEHGIDEMRAVKRALDPDGKLAPGVLFPA